MKVDALVGSGLAEFADVSRRAEEAGCDGVISPELAHDPFLPLGLAASTTQRIDLITGIAVAFARSPMTVAMTASDIHRLSGGRMILGLGSQVRAHITRRYSMPWSRPAARMRELILALRAIWACWNGEGPLAFEGEFYRHTLLTPMFDQGPSPVGDPSVFLAAVGPRMTRVAGEVADGLMLHAFTTPAYAREVTLPCLEEGLAAAGRERCDVAVTVPAMVVVCATDEERTTATQRMRGQIAFYGSTPAYRGVLDHHGWGELGDELHRLSKVGDWGAMAALVDDEVLHTFAVIVHSAEDAGTEIARRFGGIADRVQIGFDPARPEQAGRLRSALEEAL
jgi:probable F420-dependent oxidoreductase